MGRSCRINRIDHIKGKEIFLFVVPVDKLLRGKFVLFLILCYGNGVIINFMIMEEEMAMAAEEFNEGSEAPRQDLQMVLDAMLADPTYLQMLAEALAPYLTPAEEAPVEEEVTEEEVIEEE